MEIRTLHYFLAIAREENITKAAALLHITQPTLSRQIMQLEEELGVKLFMRSKHSIILTPQGQLLRRRAQDIVQLAVKTRQELNQDAELRGEISVGSGEYLSSHFLSEVVASFQEKYPAVQAEIYSGNSDNIKERIEQGTLDAGFLLEPVDVEKYEYIRSPWKEEWGIFVREDSDLAGKAFVTPEDLAEKPLIFTRRNLIVREFSNWFGDHADRLHIVASGNLPYNLVCLARQNHAVFLNLKKECKYDGMRYIPLAPALESRTVLVWKKNQMMAPLMRAFVQHIKTYMECITKDKT